MEEQKNKQVKMQPKAGDKQLELTKEQLKDMADKLFNENRYLRHQLQQAQEFANTVSRLDYLFKVVAIANKDGKYNFSSDFIERCFQEIEEAMTPSDDTQVTEDNKGN